MIKAIIKYLHNRLYGKRTTGNKSLDSYLEHLEYELRMLIGANEIVRYLEKLPKAHGAGNEINYFKDAIYLHSRNLYNFFATKPTGHDINIKQLNLSYLASTDFTSTLYTTDNWRKPLHSHVLHIGDKRRKNWNIKNGVHLNEKAKDFTPDIISLWEKWINSVSDANVKAQLQQSLDTAKRQGKNDYDDGKGGGFKNRYK